MPPTRSTGRSGRTWPLVEFVEDGLRVAGLPVLVSDQVNTATLFCGIPEGHVMCVLRKGTTVERFPAVTQDGT